MFAAIEGTDKSRAPSSTSAACAWSRTAASLERICDRSLVENPEQAELVRAGKKSVLGFFVGQVMKETGAPPIRSW